MIDKRKYKENVTRSLLSSLAYSLVVLDNIDGDYGDVEGRKWAKSLVDDWKRTIQEIDKEMTTDYLGKGAK